MIPAVFVYNSVEHVHNQHLRRYVCKNYGKLDPSKIPPRGKRAVQGANPRTSHSHFARCDLAPVFHRPDLQDL